MSDEDILFYQKEDTVAQSFKACTICRVSKNNKATLAREAWQGSALSPAGIGHSCEDSS